MLILSLLSSWCRFGKELEPPYPGCGGMAPNWQPCPYCGQQFGASSLQIHADRCRHRPDVASEMALRAEEGFARPVALPDWDHCPNCGEQYGKIAFPSHVKKCKRLRPHGANGFCAPGNDPKANERHAEKLMAKAETDVSYSRGFKKQHHPPSVPV